MASIKKELFKLDRQLNEVTIYHELSGGSQYWYITAEATIATDMWTGKVEDRGALSIGNVFMSEDAAMVARNIIAERVELLGTMDD